MRNQQNRYMQSSLLTADGTNASVYRAAELSRPMGFVSREKKNPSKQKVIEFSHCSMGKGRSHMQAHKHLSPPPARVYGEEEASSDTIIAM